MSSVAENEKRAVFKHYFDLPSELRMGINEEMEVEDRCRFTRCSSLCQKEVRKSKNYVHGLEFNKINTEHLEIHVKHKPRTAENTSFGGYILKFVKNGDEKSIEYLKSLNCVPWKVKLDDLTDLSEMACQYFKNLFQLYQNSIKELTLNGVKNYNFEIRSLNNLDKLELYGDTVLLSLTSNVRLPLTKLLVYSSEYQVLNDNEQVYHVQDYFESYRLKINYGQFLRFSTKKMKIDIGELTPSDLFDFINSWKNGTIRENFEECCWVCDSNFNTQILFKLLRIQNNGFRRQQFKIKHNTENGKFARLLYLLSDGWKSLEFKVSSQQEYDCFFFQF